MRAIHMPTRWVPLYARCAGWLLGLLSAGWLLVIAAWLALHAIIVPRIDQLRPWLEQQASQALGIHVQFSAISARSRGWVPEFEIRGVRILDSSDQPQFELDRVTLSLTPTSFIQGEFSQIVLEQLDLRIEREADGKLRIGGILIEGPSDDRWRNWAFSQWEWVLHNSRVTYTDLGLQTQPLHFEHIDGLLRNGLRNHQFRIDATPDRELGERFSWRGKFRQPLLSTQAGLWENWTGQAYFQTRLFDLQAWQKRLPVLPPEQDLQGRGWVRLWLDIQAGQLRQATTDLGLNDISIALTPNGQTTHMGLKALSGRLTHTPGRTAWWSAEQWRLQPHDAPDWLIGEAKLGLQTGPTGVLQSGEARIDHIPLETLQAWIHLLPDPWQKKWHQLAPRGELKQTQWHWTGPWSDMHIDRWQTRGEKLSIQSGPASKPQTLAAWPGLNGLSGALEGNGTQFKGHLRLEAADLSWPGLWDQPVQKINQFRTDIQGRIEADRREIQLSQAQLLLDQARTDFQLRWSGSPQDPLGQLDLQALSPQASIEQILRWLPTHLPASVRQYLRAALPQGEIRQIQATLQGRLQEFPFSNSPQSQFHIQGQLANVRYLTVPRTILSEPAVGDWPTWQNLSGEISFDRNSLHLGKVKAQLGLAPNIKWSTLDARIKNLTTPVVEVRAEGRGPLAEALQFWRSSPLHPMTDRVLEQTRAQGQADYRTTLSIPIDKPERTQVKGQVQFAGNEVAMASGAPTLNRLRGAVQFSERGFDLQGVQANLWGGDIKLEGTGKATAALNQPTAVIRAQGQLTAAGLRDAPELSDWAIHLRKLQGSTPYTAQLQWRRGQLETQISSNLVGMAIQAPSGLGKAAAEALPLRWENSLTAESASSGNLLQEQMSLRWGNLLEARYIRDLSGAQPKVLRGLIRLGTGASNALPNQGVLLRLNSDTFNLDEWSDWMQPFTRQSASSTGAWDFSPQRLEFQIRQLLIRGRPLNQVQVSGQRQADTWQARVKAQELDGDVQYLPASSREPARLQARLARLAVPASADVDNDNFLDDNTSDIPTLDIQIKDFDLRGKKLGSLELLAQNRNLPDGSREWRLSKLQLAAEDTDFSADGVWRKPVGNAPRSTQLNFKMGIKNAGDLLQRLGLPDAVRNGNGALEGQISWIGSPLNPDIPTMTGQFHVDVERGQFLKTEPGAARLLGVLSLQALPRRLLLDFRDVFSEGFAFDVFRGDVLIHKGVASTTNLQMKGVQAAVLMEGQADIGQETQNIKVLVIPDINAGGASLVYSAINPVIGLTSFIAQYILRRPIMEANTQQFQIDGTWSDPRVTRIPFKSEPKP